MATINKLLCIAPLPAIDTDFSPRVSRRHATTINAHTAHLTTVARASCGKTSHGKGGAGG